MQGAHTAGLNAARRQRRRQRCPTINPCPQCRTAAALPLERCSVEAGHTGGRGGHSGSRVWRRPGCAHALCHEPAQHRQLVAWQLLVQELEALALQRALPLLHLVGGERPVREGGRGVRGQAAPWCRGRGQGGGTLVPPPAAAARTGARPPRRRSCALEASHRSRQSPTPC